MGGISGNRDFFVEALTEIAGYKAGVVLTDVELFEILRDTEVGAIIDPDGAGGGRIHSSSFEEGAAELLFRLGNTTEPSTVPSSIRMYHKYKDTPEYPIYQAVAEGYLQFMKEVFANPPADKVIDPTPFMLRLTDQFGPTGGLMAFEYIEGTQRDLHRSPWGRIRNIEWHDTVELNALFKSAGLETQHGQFFDQRYIDYLSQNFADIDRMHWRKFEGFTAEFFSREGYRVVLGPGSNDDGVDLRVYPVDDQSDLPPLMIVQCKRQKAKIEKAVVKSVYADVIHEGATSGLIVTTSTLAPGAETTRTARNYPVEAADRAKMKEWLAKLRS